MSWYGPGLIMSSILCCSLIHKQQCESALAIFFFSETLFFCHLMGHMMTHYTLWLFNIAMENGPFTDDFRIKTSIKDFSVRYVK